MKKISLLALSGSLRKSSYNTAAINALKTLSPSNVEITIGKIEELPLFNPDMEDNVIPALHKLKHALKSSSGLIIASPEYAHGISGPLKNALDWLVSGEEFPDKPVMLINTSPRAHHAYDALKEVITTMSGNIIEPSLITIPLLGSELNAENIITDIEIASTLQSGLSMFCDAIELITMNDGHNH